MIRQPTVVRDRILSDVMYMLKHLYTMLTLLPETEVDVLLALEQPHVNDLAVQLTNMLMDKFGYIPQPNGRTAQVKDPRFDKTRRRLAKKTPKGPRGVPKSQLIQQVVEAT